MGKGEKLHWLQPDDGVQEKSWVKDGKEVTWPQEAGHRAQLFWVYRSHGAHARSWGRGTLIGSPRTSAGLRQAWPSPGFIPPSHAGSWGPPHAPGAAKGPAAVHLPARGSRRQQASARPQGRHGDRLSAQARRSGALRKPSCRKQRLAISGPALASWMTGGPSAVSAGYRYFRGEKNRRRKKGALSIVRLPTLHYGNSRQDRLQDSALTGMEGQSSKPTYLL